MLAQITVVSFLQKKAHLTCNLDYFISLFPLKRKSTFIFMTANMISCLKIEKWTCSLRFWEHKVNLSAMRLSWLCGLLLTIDYCVMALNHYCRFQKPVSCRMHWHVQDGTLTNNKTHTSLADYGYMYIDIFKWKFIWPQGLSCRFPVTETNRLLLKTYNI